MESFQRSELRQSILSASISLDFSSEHDNEPSNTLSLKQCFRDSVFDHTDQPETPVEVIT
jgi:hypothetical protein